jgi:hypothetical protein
VEALETTEVQRRCCALEFFFVDGQSRPAVIA